MVIHCPHCEHRIAIENAKPGRFRLKCPGCSQLFALTVAQDKQQARVERLDTPATRRTPTTTKRSSTDAEFDNLLADAPDELWAELQALWSADPSPPDAERPSSLFEGGPADETLPPKNPQPVDETRPPERPTADDRTTRSRADASPNAATPAAAVRPQAEPEQTSVPQPSANRTAPHATESPSAATGSGTPNKSGGAEGTSSSMAPDNYEAKPASRSAQRSSARPISDSMAGLTRHDSSETGSWSMPVGADSPLARPESTGLGATGAWSLGDGVSSAGEVEATGAHVPGEAEDGIEATEAVATTSRPTTGAGMPTELGGYRILKELGRGAMGSVYLARQLSLDRNVALKTIRADMTRNAVFVARFTREAYAAAQLIHHNVVQIYDLGSDEGTQFFSMELVEGKSLADVIKEQGRLDLQAAIGYILQAARGLKFAHDHGMVHRDVKPANLLVNNEGVVKVADLGLVKTIQKRGSTQDSDTARPQSAAESLAASSDVTMAGAAMGTPAYMAPEQSVDAADVDHRADVYSLGCTLYVLLTGRPPFEGASALDVMSKHKTEPVTRPDALVDDIPPDVSEITMKMVAKRPEERYRDLGEVIDSLETILGREKDEPFELGKEQADLLDVTFRQFYESPMAAKRPWIFGGLLLLGLVAAIAAASIGQWLLLGGLLGVLCMTPLAYFVLRGLREQDYLFEQTRELVCTNRWSDWITWSMGVVVFVAVLVVTGLWWIWLVAALLAVGIAWALLQFVDGSVATQRGWALSKARQMLRDLRLQGLEENELRSFVARFSDYHWEEFFEKLFGYEAKLAARKQFRRSEDGRLRPRFAGWRDPVIEWMQARIEARREARQQRHLARLEQQRYEAEGLDQKAARQRAEHLAQNFVRRAGQCRMTLAEASMKARAGNPEAVRQKRALMLEMLEAARTGQIDDDGGPTGWRAWGVKLLQGAFGERTRFVTGCLLLIACAIWVHQNGMIQVPAAAAWNEPGLASEIRFDFDKQTVPLMLPGLPRWTAQLFDSFNPAVAGLILILSSLIRGLRIAIFAFPATVFVLTAHHLGMPSLVPGVASNVSSMILGTGMAVFGIFLCGEQ